LRGWRRKSCSLCTSRHPPPEARSPS
jgi:hypothetical protein